LIAVLVIGISVIFVGFLFNQEDNEVIDTLTPYEKLEKYKKDLEKINQYNQQILNDLEEKITESDSVHLEQLEKEIEVLKRVISDNKNEIEQVIAKLSEMKNEQ
jgi:oligoendopeptidase F